MCQVSLVVKYISNCIIQNVGSFIAFVPPSNWKLNDDDDI